MTDNVERIDLFAKSNIPLGFLSFTLWHELVSTGSVALAAPLISSVVITKTENNDKLNPMHHCRLLHALHAMPHGGHASFPYGISPGFFSFPRSCTCSNLRSGLTFLAAMQSNDSHCILLVMCQMSK